MRKKYLIIIIVSIFAIGFYNCRKEITPISPEERQREIEESERASQAYSDAVKLIENNNPTGFLKLYKIGTDCDTYTVEYCEVANETLHYLLHSKTELWIKTFANKTDLELFKAYLKRTGIDVSGDFPVGITSEEQFRETIFNKLLKIQGDKKEMELIDYILGLYNRKR